MAGPAMQLGLTAGLLSILAVQAEAAPGSTQGLPEEARKVYAEIGKEYSVARRDLIGAGDVPIDQNHSPDKCFGTEMECSMYPELWSCAVDQQRPCRLEWRFPNGVRFYIITTGEDPLKLVVRGMDYDDQ